MKKLLLLLSITLAFQVKSQCFQIQSILVDACDGSLEGQNEMVIFQVGNTALNTSNLSVNWPANGWLGVCQNAGTASDIATVNSTITHCGLLKEPVGGVLPARSKVLLITSTDWNPMAQSFVNLSDTLIVIFQCAGNTGGHFKNYATTTPLDRTLGMSFSSPAGCSASVTYSINMLTQADGSVGGEDGGSVAFDASGHPSYFNNGCAVPEPPLSLDAGGNKTVCKNSTQALAAIASGNFTSAHWSLGSGATGSFVPTNSLTTVYTPGAGDNNSIKLYCSIMKSCPGHTVTVKDSVNLTVMQLPLPAISAGSSSICSGSTTVLSYSLSNAGATGTTSVQWLPSNATTSTISVNTAGTYSVKITDACGNSTASFTVSALPSPTVSISAGGPVQFCAGSAVVLTATSNTGNYSWTGGATTATVSANSTRTAVVTSTNTCGSASATQTVLVNPIPAASATSPQTITCTTSTVALLGSGGGSYSWSGPGIVSGGSTATPTVNQPGSYTVLVTASGCTNTAVTNVAQNSSFPSVTTAASASLNCSTTTASAVASTTTAPVSYAWSGPSVVSGATTASATVNAGGTYNYTVTNTSNGCKTTGTVSVTQNTVVITPTISAAPVITCTTPTVSLTGSPGSGVSYGWTGPGVIAPSSLSSVSLNQPGNYVLTVTNTANGCTGSASVSVTQNTTAPTVTVSPTQTLTCASPSVSISGAATPGTSSASWAGVCGPTNSYTTSACGTGTFVLTVTDPANGCSNTGSVVVISNNNLPQVTASASASLNCNTLTTSVVASTTATPVSYTWTGPGIVSGATTASATVNVGGTYSYTVTNTSSGCASTGNISVTQNATVITPTISAAPVITCTTPTVSLTGSPGSGVSYGWTGPGVIAPSSLSSVSLNQPGNYVLTVTNTANGCTGSASVSVTQNTTAPTVTVSPTQTLTCASPSVSISGAATPGTSSASWAGVCGPTNSYTTSACGTGTFVLTVTDPANGCSNTGSVVVISNNSLPQVTASASASLNCNTLTTSVVASTTATPVSYTWTGPGIVSGATTASATVNVGGTYSYTVTNTSSGCASTGNISVTQNTIQPGANASTGSMITCTSNTVILSSSPGTGVTYTWSAAGGSSVLSGVNTSTATAQGYGPYTVTIEDNANGCVSSATVAPGSNTVAITPTISAAPVITCSTPTVNLTGNPGSGVSYSWTGPGVIAPSSLSNVSLNQPGNYVLTVTNTANGCTGSASVSVTQNTVAPTVTVSPTQTITCASPSVSISGTATPGTSSASWAGVCGPANSFSTTACATGTFVLTVTDPANGCSNTGSVVVGSSNDLPQVTSSPNNSITCSTGSVQVAVTTTASPVSYSWTGPGNIASPTSAATSVDAGGTYTCVVTNTSSGCAATITSFVPTNTTAVLVTVSPSASITCIATTQTLSALPGGSSYTFSWSGAGVSSGANTANPVVNAGGDYSVTITDAVSGCTGTNVVSVPQDNAVPTVTISPNTFTVSCATPTVQLIANPSAGTVSYSWTSIPSGALNSNSIANPIASVGTFSAVVTNTVNGCVSLPAFATVSADASVPTVSLSAGNVSITCSNSSPSVAITSTISTLSYSWNPAPSNGSTTPNPVFGQPGTYSCVVTNTANGCSTSANVTVASYTTPPIVSVPGTQTLTCSMSTAVITTTTTPAANMTYTWSGAGITGTPNTSSISVNQAGTYSLTVQDAVTGCSTTVTSDVISIAGVPNASITASGTATAISCANPALTLTATSNPSANIAYTWSTGSTGNTSSVSSAGVITLTVVNTVSSCSATVQYTVTGDTVVPDLTAANGNFPCGASSTTLSASSTNTNVSYAWTGPAPGSILSGSNTSMPSIGEAGNYTVTVTNTLTGCSNSNTVNVSQSSVTAAFTADPNAGVAPLTVHFANQSTGASTYEWSFGDNNSSSNQNPNDVYNANGSFTVMLIASSGSCSDTAYAVIVINEGLTVEIPNVFTPNGDNVNDVFDIKSTGVKEISLQIFNRWGQKLYEFSGPKASWDGRTDVGERVPDGTYFFFVKATGYDDKTIEQHGTLSLFR